MVPGGQSETLRGRGRVGRGRSLGSGVKGEGKPLGGLDAEEGCDLVLLLKEISSYPYNGMLFSHKIE